MATAPARPGILNRLLRGTFRVLFFTLLFAGLGMALGLLTGILVTVIGAFAGHHAADLSRAYKVFAVPSAIVTGSVAFLYNLVRAIAGAVKK